MISDYAELLAGKLRFDRSLARCVRQEVEDHLWEAVAADPAGDLLEAQRRAIANFGDPQIIAAQFAVASLAKQTKKIGIAVILVIAGVFMAMKTRIAWYGLTQWTLSDEMRAVGGIVSSIDRYAFWLSVIAGIAGWASISWSRASLAFDRRYHARLHRGFLLCAVATGALVTAVIGDAVLTALRLFGTGMSAAFLIPIVSMAIEIVCAGVLAVQIRGATQRMSSTNALLKT